jgi:hypothetical protein
LEKMDDSRLNADLKILSEQPIPDLTADVDALVWASIEATKSRVLRETWLNGLVSAFLRPAWLTAALALTILVGANFGRILVNPASSGPHQPLGLEVFAADAPALPATLLDRSR